jgi:hypothetical protein
MVPMMLSRIDLSRFTQLSPVPNFGGDILTLVAIALVAEEIDRPVGVVPSNLFEQNPSLEEFSTKFSIPFDATGKKYIEFHQKLLGGRGQADKARALAVAKDVGFDMARIEKDMASDEAKKTIEENMKLADALGKRRRPKLPVPFLTPRLSSLWIGLVTPVDTGVARPLIEPCAPCA